MAVPGADGGGVAPLVAAQRAGTTKGESKQNWEVGPKRPASTGATLAATGAVHCVCGVRAARTPTVSWGLATRAPVPTTYCSRAYCTPN